VLDGSLSPDSLAVRSGRFYDDLRIEPILGKRATGIDPENRTVEIGSDAVISYDKLLIASGADARRIRIPGADLDGVFYMRNERHVRQIVRAIPDAGHALVFGGGLVGFKAAYGLLHRGLKTTMLIKSGYPLSMQTDETAGKIILDELLRRGMNVRTGTDAVAFEGNRKVSTAVLSDGTSLPCDLAVIGKGVRPALSFVPRSLIPTDLGILVDDHMETGVPGVYAAGDVAETEDIARKTRWVNAIWPEAVNQGRIAGLNMAGRAVPYKGSLSRNTIRIFDLDVMSGGVFTPPSDDSYRILTSRQSLRNTYRKLVFRDDTLAGMIMINDIEQGGVLLSMIQNKTRIRISEEALLEPSFNYGKLIGEFRR
jgi:NAD(P)H-nitrite reductase large subunit